jgi:hypothetical protein
MSSTRWDFRGVQMDLARQYETVEYIQEFTDLLAEGGLIRWFCTWRDGLRRRRFRSSSPRGAIRRRR